MTIDVTRAWKDEEYFSNLSDSQRAALPANPAGIVDLRDEQLEVVVGGSTTIADSSQTGSYNVRVC